MKLDKTSLFLLTITIISMFNVISTHKVKKNHLKKDTININIKNNPLYLNRVEYDKRVFRVNSNMIDNSSDKDCMPKALVTEQMLDHLKDKYPLKYLACTSLWESNNGMPGSDIIEYYNKQDANPDMKFCNKATFESAKASNPLFESTVKNLLPNTFKACEELWANGGNAQQEPQPVNEDFVLGPNAAELKNQDPTSSVWCQPKAALSPQDLAWLEKTKPNLFKACTELWASNNNFPGASMLEFFKKMNENPRVEACFPNEESFERNKDLANVIKTLLPNLYSLCKEKWSKGSAGSPVTMKVNNNSKDTKNIKISNNVEYLRKLFRLNGKNLR